MKAFNPALGHGEQVFKGIVQESKGYEGTSYKRSPKHCGGSLTYVNAGPLKASGGSCRLSTSMHALEMQHTCR